MSKRDSTPQLPSTSEASTMVRRHILAGSKKNAVHNARIRAKAVEFSLHLAVTRRAGANTPLDAAGILKDAQVFLGFLQGRQPTRRRLSAFRRDALHVGELTWRDMVERATSRLARERRESQPDMSNAATRFIRAMRQYDAATFARLAGQVEAAIEKERRSRALSPKGSQLAAGRPNRTLLSVTPVAPIPQAIGRPLPAQGGPDHSPWPRPVCTSPAAPLAGPSFPGKAAVDFCQAASPLPRAFGASTSPGEA